MYWRTYGATDDPDYFEIGELEYAAESLQPNKASDFDGLGLDIIRAVL